MTNEEMLAKIAELTAANEALKAGRAAKTTAFGVQETTWTDKQGKAHPMLRVEGPGFMPFNIGRQKAKHLYEPEIEAQAKAFLAKPKPFDAKEDGE